MADNEMNMNEKTKRGRSGNRAPLGNRNAAKEGQDLRFEVYLSKTRRGFLEEWFEMVYGYKPTEEKLREVARQLANTALDRAIIEEFERRQPGRVLGSSGDVF